MDEEELKTLKQEVRSLLISSSSDLTLRELLRDFKTNMGYDLPFQRLGCNNPVELLCLMPDVVLVTHRNGNISLSPVRSSKSSHVLQLVSEQKKDKRPNGVRRVQPLRTSSRTYPPPIPLVPNFELWKKGLELSPFPRGSTNTRYFCDNYKSRSFRSKSTTSSTPLRTVSTSPGTKEDYSCGSEWRPLPSTTRPPKSHGMENSIEEEAKAQSSKDNCVEERLEISSGSSMGSSSSYDTISRSSQNEEINEKVKNRFKEILKENPKGVFLSKFPAKYKQKYGHSFSCTDYGFRSLKELVIALQDVFKHEKCTSNDWLLFDLSHEGEGTGSCKKSIPQEVMDNMAVLAAKFPTGLYGSQVLQQYLEHFGTTLGVRKMGFENINSFLVFCPSINCRQIEDELVIFAKRSNEETSEGRDNPPPLPSIDMLSHVWGKFFPEDVCLPSDSYKPFALPPGPFTFIKVKLADLQDPYSIWFHLMSQVEVLENLMDELNIFYLRESTNYKMNTCAVKAGQMCALRFYEDKRWHRGLIEEVKSGVAKISFVDYGTIDQNVSITELHYLHKKFSEEPIRAIKSELFNIKKPRGLKHWPPDTNSWLFNTLLNKVLVIEIVKVYYDEPKLDVNIYDTTAEEDIFINERIVEMKFAVFKCDPSLVIDSVSQPSDSTNQETVEEDVSSIVIEEVDSGETGAGESESCKEAPNLGVEEKAEPVSSPQPAPIVETSRPAMRPPMLHTHPDYHNAPQFSNPPHFHPQQNNAFFAPRPPQPTFQPFCQFSGMDPFFNDFPPCHLFPPFHQQRMSHFHNMPMPFQNFQQFNTGPCYRPPPPPPPGFPPLPPQMDWPMVTDYSYVENQWAPRPMRPQLPPIEQAQPLRRLVTIDKGTDTEDLESPQSNTSEPSLAHLEKSEATDGGGKTSIDTEKEWGPQECDMLTSVQPSPDPVRQEVSITDPDDLDEGLVKQSNESPTLIQSNSIAETGNAKFTTTDSLSDFPLPKLNKKNKRSLSPIKLGETNKDWIGNLDFLYNPNQESKASSPNCLEGGGEMKSNDKETLQSKTSKQANHSQHVYKIGVSEKCLHLLRVEDTFMIPAMEFYRNFCNTFIEVIDYRCHIYNLGRPSITIYEEDIPEIFCELKKENVCGVEPSTTHLAVIQTKNIPRVLAKLFPRDERLSAAFEQVLAFERDLLNAGK